MEKQKKKMTLTQFFLIYIIILACILLGVSACTGSVNSGDTQVLSENTVSPSDNGNTSPAPSATQAANTATPSASATPDVGNSGDPSPVTDPSPAGGSLAGLKVSIDPGHQAQAPSGTETTAPWSSQTKLKNTSGTKGTSTGTDEYILNLQIALKLRDSLTAQGATVIMTRDNNDTSLSNQDRANISNKNNVDIIISIHCNGADSASANGTEVYSRGSGDGSAEYAARSSAEAKLAAKLVDAIVAETGAKNRGAKLSDSYTGINYANAPCFIVECGFLSNPEEDKKLNDSSYQDKIVAGIKKFLEENKSALSSS